MAKREFDYREFHLRTPIVFTDLETGGRDSRIHPILTIGMVTKLRGETYNPLYIRIKWKDYKNVEEGALRVNGINLEEHHYHPDALSWTEANELVNSYVLSQRCGKVRPGGHNFAGFDQAFIRRFQKNYEDLFMGFIVDTQLIAQDRIEQGRLSVGRVNLETLCNHFGIDLSNAHNALDDVLATAALHNKLMSM